MLSQPGKYLSSYPMHAGETTDDFAAAVQVPVADAMKRVKHKLMSKSRLSGAGADADRAGARAQRARARRTKHTCHGRARRLGQHSYSKQPSNVLNDGLTTR